MKSKKLKIQAVGLGDLPVDKINKALGTEFDSGTVVFSAGAQKHAERRHSEDYHHSLPFVGGIISNPLYIGDDGKNLDKIELIGNIPALGSHLLIAIEIKKDAAGNYNVVSFYKVKQTQVNSRKSKGRLIISH